MASSAAPQTDRRLRVLCCSGSLEGGGSERQLWQLATQLDRQQFSPSVYLLYRRGHYIDQLPSDVSVSAFWDSFDETKRYWPGQIRRLQIDHLAKCIREQRIDVVYDRTFHMTLVTAAAASRAGVRRVSVIVSPPSADFQKSRERFRFFKKRLLARAYRQPGCVTIAVSDEVADDAAKFYQLERARILSIPNPVDIDAVRAAAGPMHDSKFNAPRIAVVGRLSREKGQRLGLQALQRANISRTLPLSMDIVGDGPDRAELEQLAGELGIQKHVKFHGFVANPYPLIAAASAVCIPSEHEGLPNVALESMVIGTPLVATDCSGALRVLVGKNERGALVQPDDVSGLAEAFKSVAVRSEIWSKRCEAARVWVESKHAIAPWLDEMSRILHGESGSKQASWR